MKIQTLILMAIAFSFSLSGCAYKTQYIQNNATAYQPVSEESVLIYAKEPLTPGYTYNVIGPVASDAATLEDAITLVKKAAAKIGGNVIINARLNKLQSFTVRTGVSGIAVRFFKKEDK